MCAFVLDTQLSREFSHARGLFSPKDRNLRLTPIPPGASFPQDPLYKQHMRKDPEHHAGEESSHRPGTALDTVRPFL